MTFLQEDLQILNRYKTIRQFSLELCKPLIVEDFVIQTMNDVSPTKWHLAHTTWFFEQMILVPYLADYNLFHNKYSYLFNSYYNSLGSRHCRSQRGFLSRPTVEHIRNYRDYVDDAIEFLLIQGHSQEKEIFNLIELSLHHEQQHQELILTDIKHVFACNPLDPIYSLQPRILTGRVPEIRWRHFPQGLCEIGHHSEEFAFDNEKPRHSVFLNSFRAANRLVTNQEFIEFIDDKGYQRPEFWLSEGWEHVQKENWQAPLYWEKQNNEWLYFTLSGLRKVIGEEPVCHVSFFEADAYAKWAGKRLLREEEWEMAARRHPVEGNFVENRYFHPQPETSTHPSEQFFGDVWEWTSSPYVGYPGYHSNRGPLGEYNGKFMCNQMVLRGGSCVTSQSHIRPTYRNFFPPSARWQFSGIRLGEDDHG
jgi:ergothioneine biosynthesis protein EgtB